MWSWVYDTILVLSSFFFAFTGTALAYAILKYIGVMDTPNERSNHKQPTPRGGGIGIVFAVLSFLWVIDASGVLLGALFLLALLCFLDDLQSIAPQWRLLTQMVLAAWVLVELHDPTTALFPESMPEWVIISVLTLVWVWFMNLFNFMDGADGLASGEALSLCLGVVALWFSVEIPYELFLHSLIIGSAVLGFALWNWPPARIFMGDVGSIPLGFLLGYLLLSIAFQGYWHAALILPAYFVTDATVTLKTRMLRGEKFWKAHSRHAYQRALRAGKTHGTVSKAVIGLNLFLIPLAVLSTLNVALAWFSLGSAYLLALLLMLYFSSRRPSAGVSLHPAA